MMRNCDDLDLARVYAIDNVIWVVQQNESAPTETRERVALRSFCYPQKCVLDLSNKSRRSRCTSLDVPVRGLQ
jgi:hypothetical protein